MSLPLRRTQAILLMSRILELNWWELLDERQECSQTANPTRSSIAERQIRTSMVQQSL